MTSAHANTATPIFDALNAEFIEQGIKVKALMSRKTPPTSWFVRSSEGVGEEARKKFLDNFRKDNGSDAAAKVIPMQRDGKGRFQKRLNG